MMDLKIARTHTQTHTPTSTRIHTTHTHTPTGEIDEGQFAVLGDVEFIVVLVLHFAVDV